MTTERAAAAFAMALLTAYRGRQVTLREAAAAVETRFDRTDCAAAAALRELFPLGVRRAPEPAVIDLALQALRLGRDEGETAALLALALRRPVLATILERVDEGESVPLAILRPGCRVMLGTASGRDALHALVAGDLDPTARWLDNAVVDIDAFAATPPDVPPGHLGGVADRVGRVVRGTATLPPGRAGARVADEWVSEVTVDSLDDGTPYTVIVRVVGERLLESDAPALLWHAARQLSLVAGGDRRVAERVVERCLPLARLEDGRSPASAAAPFLTVLPAERAASLLERIAPRLDNDGWDAVARVFLAGAFRTRWQDWRPHAMRWANGSDPGLARAATS